MNRYKAFAIHLLISVSVFSIFLMLTLFVWYPDYLFRASGTLAPVLVMACVDVGLGPLMTLILVKKGKALYKIRNDLTIIGSIQLIALLYGGWVVYSQRPAILVHYNHIFFCISQAHTQVLGIDTNQFAAEGFIIPQAFLPDEDYGARDDWDAHLSALPKDSSRVPVFIYGDLWQPFNADTLQQILQKELAIETAVNSPPKEKHQAEWQAFLSRHSEAEAKQYAYYSMSCGPSEYVGAMDRESGAVQDAMEIFTLNAKFKKTAP